MIGMALGLDGKPVTERVPEEHPVDNVVPDVARKVPQNPRKPEPDREGEEHQRHPHGGVRQRGEDVSLMPAGATSSSVMTTWI